MMLLESLMLWALFAVDMPTQSEVGCKFHSVAAAMKVNEPGLRGDLSAEALQYIMDSTGLGWSVNWSKHSRDPELRASVSSDRAFCIACRGHYGEFGSGVEVECCLIDSSSTIRWQRRIGATWEDPRVSTKGHVAFLAVGEFNPSTEVRAYEVILLVYDSLGNAFVSENLGAYAGRMVGFEEVYDFSPDGSLFFTTMNAIEKPTDAPNPDGKAGHCNTTLHVFDLEGHKHYMHSLGAFQPRGCECVQDTVDVRGASAVVRILGGGSRIEWAKEAATDSRGWHLTGRCTRRAP